MCDLPGEIWKPITEFPEAYMVSNKGRIKTLRRIINGKVRVSKILRLRLDTCTGYMKFNAFPGNTSVKIHRCVAEAFVPKTADDIRLNRNVVNHKDGVKINNDAANLEWCTFSENNLHAIANNLNSSHGETHPCVKLSNKQVIEIRKRAKMGALASDLCLDYDLTLTEIYRIVRGVYYKEVNDIESPYFGSFHNSSRFIIPNRRLTKDQVIDIRQRFSLGEKISNIARDYNIPFSSLSRVCHNKSYTDIDQSISTNDSQSDVPIHNLDKLFYIEDLIKSGKS